MPNALDDPRVRAYIEQSAGPEGMRLAELLLRKEEATDSELAEELGEKPSHIRKILYNLYEARVAEYHKEKDKETGWLTFYWQINPDHAQYALGQKIKKEILSLEAKLRYEEGHEFFVCPVGTERFDFAEATEHEFHCPQHGTILDHRANDEEKQALRARIAELRSFAESG